MDGFDISALRAFNNPSITDANAIINKCEDGGIKQNGTYTGALSALSRSTADKAANNEARTFLLQSLGKAIGMDATVKDGKVTFSETFMDTLEAKLGKEFKRSDFGINAKGEVDSGRPLTQRRIMAILAKAKEQAQQVEEANKKSIAPEVVDETIAMLNSEPAIPQPPMVDESSKVNEASIASYAEIENPEVNDPVENPEDVIASHAKVENLEVNDPVEDPEVQHEEEVNPIEVNDPVKEVVIPNKPSRANKLPQQHLSYLEHFIENVDKAPSICLPDFHHDGQHVSIQQAIAFCHLLTADEELSPKEVFEKEEALTKLAYSVLEGFRVKQQEENTLTLKDYMDSLALNDEDTRYFIYVIENISSKIDTMRAEGKLFTSVDEIIDFVEEYYSIFPEDKKDVANDAEASKVESKKADEKKAQSSLVDQLYGPHKQFFQKLLRQGDVLMDAMNYEDLPDLPTDCEDTPLALAAAIYLLGVRGEHADPKFIFMKCGKELMLARAIIIEHRTPEMVKELLNAMDKLHNTSSHDDKWCLYYYDELSCNDFKKGIFACADVPKDYDPKQHTHTIEDALAVIPEKYHAFIRGVNQLCDSCLEATSLEEIMNCIKDVTAKSK